jgi:hypothetical protein
LCPLAATQPALAHARPQTSLGIPGAITAGQPTAFAWTAKSIPSRTALVVQRQEGTRSVWRTVVRLGQGTKGSGTLPRVPIGSYRLRIADLDRRGHVLSEQRRRVNAFGDVTFSSLFGRGGGGSGAGVYNAPTTVFPYALNFYNGVVNYSAFTVAPNPCRSVHLTFIAGPPGEGEDVQITHQHGTATIVQESADPVSATAVGNSVATIDAQLVPGQSWGVRLAQDGGLLFRWYVNGSANCDRTSASANEPPE